MDYSDHSRVIYISEAFYLNINWPIFDPLTPLGPMGGGGGLKEGCDCYIFGKPLCRLLLISKLE